MRLTITIFLCLFTVSISYAQNSDPVYVNFQEIDDSQYKDSPSFYVIKLKMILATEQGMATASWEAHKSLTKFLVELRDPTNDMLFHRKIYREKSITIPSSAKLTVYPIHLNLKGKPKRTTLAQTIQETAIKERKQYETALKMLERDQHTTESSTDNIPWRWIFRGIGLLALIIGIIAKFASKNDNEFKDYDRRNRKP